ncbi:MAG: tetraacyldisaccharide 4'-kinase [Candidatus Marinimicrobia bacterium]|nr:tetraacyldisaccharide 4'-kinase [Candidatus Neomarinimicrobiota bacterium]MBL7108719.1 tetraacyldisaccharide 4'-kinase [Candidatus Neomarinimicrobiota bacterium]
MVRFILFNLSLIYRFIVFLRNTAYDFGILKVKSFDKPVISIGNITTGGTGKTPMTIFVADELIKLGKTPGVVSRGYKRQSKGCVVVCDGNKICTDSSIGGDEPYLIASSLKIPVIVDENRSRGIEKIINEFAVDVVILDDAFQHRKAHRDLDIVLIDTTDEISQLKLLPLGKLREPLQNLKRADIVCYTKTDFPLNDRIYNKYLSNKAIKVNSNHHPILQKHNENVNLEKGIFAFCGIANPNSFIESCNNLEIIPDEFIPFSDHVIYTEKKIEYLNNKILQSNCDIVMTTEKDLVKLPTIFINKHNLSIVKIKTKMSEENRKTLISQIRNTIQNT